MVANPDPLGERAQIHDNKSSQLPSRERIALFAALFAATISGFGTRRLRRDDHMYTNARGPIHKSGAGEGFKIK